MRRQSLNAHGGNDGTVERVRTPAVLPTPRQGVTGRNVDIVVSEFVR